MISKAAYSARVQRRIW